jgi:tetratricopeptide (TPR) repeat protein
LTEIFSEQLRFKIQMAYLTTCLKTGDNTAFRSAIEALPASWADDRSILSLRLYLALTDRDWQQAAKLIEQMKGTEDNQFAYAIVSVPVGCYTILLARMQGEEPPMNASFTETREHLNQKVKKLPEKAAYLLSNLAVIDALLGQKEAAISEAKRAIAILPISKDPVDGPAMEVNLAIVYTWTNELDLAFETLSSLTKTPFGIYYGELKLEPYWDPLRKDPRYEKLLAELVPKD